MKNLFKLIGIAAIVAVIGFSMIACDNGSSPPPTPTPTPTPTASINGTWVMDDDESTELKIDDGSFEMTTGGFAAMKGTFTTSGRNFTMTLTHIHGDFLNAFIAEMFEEADDLFESIFYSRSEIETVLTDDFMSDEEADEFLDSAFSAYTVTGTYSVTSTKLTLTSDGVPASFTKQ